jgi:hypothetical protein
MAETVVDGGLGWGGMSTTRFYFRLASPLPIGEVRERLRHLSPMRGSGWAGRRLAIVWFMGPRWINKNGIAPTAIISLSSTPYGTRLVAAVIPFPFGLLVSTIIWIAIVAILVGAMINPGKPDSDLWVLPLVAVVLGVADYVFFIRPAATLKDMIVRATEALTVSGTLVEPGD